MGFSNTLKKVFRDCHTGMDNANYDWAKVYGGISVVCYLGMCAWHLRDDDVFDPITFATGLSAIIVAVCGGVAIKRLATPNPVAGSSSKKTTTETEVNVAPNVPPPNA